HQVEESIYSMEGPFARGTGFAVQGKSGKTYLITNAHVCDQPMPIMYAVDYEGKSHLVVKLELYEEHDLCILSAPEDAKPLDLADEVIQDERVFIVGYPLIQYMSSMTGHVKGHILTE